MDHNHLTIKTFMAITAERDAAIRERNMALDERKRAFAERDLAMLHRDAAIAERNSAIHERDEAIATLRYQESSMNDTISIPNSLEIVLSPESAKNNQYPHQVHINETDAYNSRENSLSITEPSQTTKPKKGRQPKDEKSTKSNKAAKVDKRMAEGSSNSNGWIVKHNSISDDEDSEKQVSWKDNMGLNQINFDDTAMPVPVCSCTGSPQPCYRWGSGGWQSACCTTTISMYPLPQMANKRYSRIGGRKMSGSAFSKLLNRLASDGHDFSTPLDLKDHWAKHGTNRYSTLK